VTLSGQLARIVGRSEILVSSLHQQALDGLGAGLVVEGVAPDGTIEAVRVADAPGFAIGVQFHPEWHYASDPPSQAIFRAFGEACRCYARRQGEGSALDPPKAGGLWKPINGFQSPLINHPTRACTTR
jgi:putative glutamine amidotransferase